MNPGVEPWVGARLGQRARPGCLLGGGQAGVPMRAGNVPGRTLELAQVTAPVRLHVRGGPCGWGGAGVHATVHACARARC